MKNFRVDMFDSFGQHNKIYFEDYKDAKRHAQGVKKDMRDNVKVFLLEHVVDGKYDVLEEITNMQKFAVKMTETLTRTVVVEAESYEVAESKVLKAYDNVELELHADNSCVELDLSDDTANYVEIFGKEEFGKMGVSEELRNAPVLPEIAEEKGYFELIVSRPKGQYSVFVSLDTDATRQEIIEDALFKHLIRDGADLESPIDVRRMDKWDFFKANWEQCNVTRDTNISKERKEELITFMKGHLDLISEYHSEFETASYSNDFNELIDWMVFYASEYNGSCIVRPLWNSGFTFNEIVEVLGVRGLEVDYDEMKAIEIGEELALKMKKGTSLDSRIRNASREKSSNGVNKGVKQKPTLEL